VVELLRRDPSFWICSSVNGALRLIYYSIQAYYLETINGPVMWRGGTVFTRQVAGCSIIRKFLICLSTFYSRRTLMIYTHFATDLQQNSSVSCFFAWNIYYLFLVNRFAMDHDFLLFSPYLDKVTRMSWPSFPSICLLPSDGVVVSNPYIILVSTESRVLSHWQTRLYHKHGNQSVVQHSIINQNVFL